MKRPGNLNPSSLWNCARELLSDHQKHPTIQILSNPLNFEQLITALSAVRVIDAELLLDHWFRLVEERGTATVETTPALRQDATAEESAEFLLANHGQPWLTRVYQLLHNAGCRVNR